MKCKGKSRGFSWIFEKTCFHHNYVPMAESQRLAVAEITFRSTVLRTIFNKSVDFYVIGIYIIALIATAVNRTNLYITLYITLNTIYWKFQSPLDFIDLWICTSTQCPIVADGDRDLTYRKPYLVLFTSKRALRARSSFS